MLFISEDISDAWLTSIVPIEAEAIIELVVITVENIDSTNRNKHTILCLLAEIPMLFKPHDDMNTLLSV
jgi:hypothetical protein